MPRSLSVLTLATALGLVAATLSPEPAAANDSSAELGAGGIELVPNFDIEIAREDLYISPDLVAIRYVFRNISEEPVRILVAFPLPDIDMADLFEVDVGIPSPQAANFVDFQTSVNGEPVAVTVEQRAISQGLDQTERLAAHGIPLNPFAPETAAALDRLDEETREAFRKLGIAYAYEPHDPLMPFWTLRTVFYWEQEFPPKTETIVEHGYRPVVGAGFFGTYLFDTEDPDGFIETYCIDQPTQTGIRKRIAETGGDYLIEHRLSYILTTARNWQGPIGDFRLVIDKAGPRWLVSLCLDGLKKIAPTQFEFTATDYVPERDLKVLFLQPPG